MISLTNLRAVAKLCMFDPKEDLSKWKVFARDDTANAHFIRARTCINFYFDGVRGIEIILEAVWHLLAGLAKNEEIRTKLQETKRSYSPRENSKNAENSGVDSNTDSR